MRRTCLAHDRAGVGAPYFSAAMKNFLVLILAVAAAAAAAVYFLGVRPRLGNDAALATELREERHPPVNIAIARRSRLANELILPAALQPFQDAPIYARTNGYIARWMVDIGGEVKAGQTLAIIESPEVDQQLNQARANLEQDRANLEFSRVTASRWQDLGKHNAVAQQDVDERTADYAVKQANLKAAQANVDRLLQLQKFETVTAPFDGVISVRNIDIGTLINAGAGPELFRVTQSRILRVYVSVPQNYIRSVHVGLPVDVLVPEFPNRPFPGKITRFAGALEADTRTLQTEVQIPNPRGELFPGMFGQIRLRLSAAEPSLVVPSNSVVIRADGAKVATVVAGNKIAFRKVALGRDFGSQIEIVNGIDDGARVVSNPSDALAEGAVVEPIMHSADSNNGAVP